MPISFSCGQCGKDYMVSDALAGKRAVCKACDFRMTVPGGPAAAPAAPPRPAAAPPRPAPARPASSPKGDVPVARVVSRPASAPQAKARPDDVPVARVVSRQAELADDIYGLNEAPAALPRMTPRSAAAEDATTAEAPAKKKKKKGFFSSGKKKSSAKWFPVRRRRHRRYPAHRHPRDGGREPIRSLRAARQVRRPGVPSPVARPG